MDAFSHPPRCYFIESGFLPALGAAVLLFVSTAGVASADGAPPVASPQGAGGQDIPEVVITDSREQAKEGGAESGYRNKTGALGPLGKASLQDTPYSLHVTSGELIENTNAHSQADALKTNPTAMVLASPNVSSNLARIMIRGFNASDQSEMRDGLVDRSFTYPPLENVERIEVLNGFNSFLYGFSNPGGTINYVTKGPTEEPLAAINTGRYGGGIDFVHGDLGGPVPGSDGKLGYRVNAYREDGSTYLEGGKQRRTMVSAATSYSFTPDTVLTTDVWHQEYKVQGLAATYTVNPAAGIYVPKASALSVTRQNGQNWTYGESDKTVGGVRFDSKLSDIFSLRAGYRYGYMSRNSSTVNNTFTNNDSTYRENYTISVPQYETTHSEYLLMDARFKTWDVHHILTFGYTGTDFYYTRGDDLTGTLGTTNIGAPAQYAVSAGTGNTAVTNWQKPDQDNYLIGDRVQLSEQVSLLGGVNYAVYRMMAGGTSNAISTASFTAQHASPSVGIVYSPIPTVSTYASYAQALTGGESTTSATAVNRLATLAPSVSDQIEGGVKATLGGMDLTAALFRLDKINAVEDPTDHVYKHDGREIHQGLEFTATGKVTDRLAFVGGFTIMDARMVDTTYNPALEGKIPQYVPERMAKAYLEYALPFLPHLFLTGGANYYGRRPVDALNTDYIDSALTFDAGLRFEPEVYGHPIAVGLNVTNIFDSSYWAPYNGLTLGAPRIVSFNVKARW